MREDRLRERHHLLGTHAGVPADPRVTPPRDPAAEPIRGLQRVEAASLDQLTAAERAVDAQPLGGRLARALDQVGELLQGCLHTELDTGSERPGQRPAEFRYQAPDLVHDLGGKATPFFPDLHGESSR